MLRSTAAFPTRERRRSITATGPQQHSRRGVVVLETATAAAARRPAALRLLQIVVTLLFGLGYGQGPRLVSADVKLTWRNVASMPYATGETSAGILKGRNGEPLLLVVGFNPANASASAATMVLDINANKWSVRAQRPFVGHHMAAVTAFNKLYLIGGYLAGTTDNMQMYDPITDTWSVGPRPLFKSGAAGAAVLGDTIYHCGGVDQGNTVSGLPITTCAKFHIPSGSWSRIAPMPHAAHHIAMATDGQQRVFVFGGRNSKAGTGLNPVNYTQVYFPGNNTWASNSKPGGPAATPAGRGGMGAAVFYKGQFYIIGGEIRCNRTWMGNCPNPSLGLTSLGVLNRVDRYNAATNTWDKGLPGMSLARHGAYPVVGPAPNSTGQVVYVCAGGVKQSFSENTICTYMSVP